MEKNMMVVYKVIDSGLIEEERPNPVGGRYKLPHNKTPLDVNIVAVAYRYGKNGGVIFPAPYTDVCGRRRKYLRVNRLLSEEEIREVVEKYYEGGVL